MTKSGQIKSKSDKSIKFFLDFADAWWTAQITNKTATQAKEITEAACKRNVSFFCNAAAEFGLRLENVKGLQNPEGMVQG